MAVNYHPLDFASLNKGDVLTAEQIQKITGEEIGTDKFKLASMTLKERIMDERRKMSAPVTVKFDHNQLRILTDAEAAVYNARRFRHGLRHAGRSHRRQMEVDVRELGDDEKREHERGLLINGAILLAARSARSIAIQSHKRSTPGLPAPT